jgi:hypothetical protein
LGALAVSPQAARSSCRCGHTFYSKAHQIRCSANQRTPYSAGLQKKRWLRRRLFVVFSMRHAASGFVAGLHAPAAGICANAAMLMHTGVLFAFVRAKPARRRTNMKHASNHFFVEAGTARGEPAGDAADIGTIQIEPDALGERLDLFLCEAGIGARGTRLGTGVAFLNAADQHVIGLAVHVWVCADHFLGLHRDTSGSHGTVVPNYAAKKKFGRIVKKLNRNQQRRVVRDHGRMRASVLGHWNRVPRPVLRCEAEKSRFVR